MPDLLIRIKKKNDGSAALTCTRANGSVTWQRQDGQLGRFFPLHDLTHYSVESVLGFSRAFYGLVAEGWDMSDFGGVRSKQEPLEEAMVAELIVGMFDLERATGVRPTAEEFNEKIVSWLADNKHPPTEFRITESQVGRIREVRAELFERWRALPSGDALEIPFERSHQSAR
jgi:hypothetical protein